MTIGGDEEKFSIRRPGGASGAVFIATIREISVGDLAWSAAFRGDDKNLYVTLGVGLIPANKKKDDVVKITSSQGPTPKPKVRGRIVFDKDGKPEMKLDPLAP